MNNIYKDIASRTDGDIYIGVVGPVRTGKSTFIKRFMELMIIPNINNAYKKERARDELPVSGAGKMIMTTEPKFIPNEAIRLTLSDNADMNVRLIDCVGYIVDDATGHMDEDMPRMVKTPWMSEEIPFCDAAELGTRKVIREHSTIGLVVTSDGSITGIERENYIQAEDRVINELKEINKPFLIVLNSTQPYSDYTKKLANELENKHSVPVLPIDCDNLSDDDVTRIFETLLMEFPLCRIDINIPSWIEVLSDEHQLKNKFYSDILSSVGDVTNIREAKSLKGTFVSFDSVERVEISHIDLSSGSILFDIYTEEGLFYQVLKDQCGFEIGGKEDLIKIMCDMAEMKKQYDKIKDAWEEVEETGYSIVCPTMDDMSLEEPEIVKQGNKFGVKLRASAPSYHIIKANVETEIAPVVGSEKQSEELVHYLLKEFDESPEKIWESHIFGKTLHDLVNEGLHTKLQKMPIDAQLKLSETLEKIINEGSGGLICIIL